MNNDLLKTFENARFGKIRVTLINDKPMLCLADVCNVLDLTNPSRVKQRLKPKGITEVYTPTNGGTQKLLFIDQPNFYRAVFQSKKPEAEIISDWVVEEVLPSIFETGSYSLQKPDSYMIEDPAERARRWAEEYEEKKALESQVAVKDQQIALMQPKVTYCDVVLNTPDLVSVTSIAKDYGWSAKKLNKTLCNLGIQYWSGGHWYLYQKYASEGYADSKTIPFPGKDGTIHSTRHTYWTQKGRLFIYEKLKACGILPISERPKQLELLPYDFGGLWS